MAFSRRRGSAADDAASDQASSHQAGGRHARRRWGPLVGSRRARAGGDAELDDDADFDDDDFDDQADRPLFGPYDASAAPKQSGGLDLGALRIPAVKGVEVKLEAGPQGEIQSVVFAHGASRLQLGAYAAPRTEGIWDEVRSDLRAAMVAKGARPEEIDGDYGIELRARVKQGNTTTDVRHVGVDGPRWFVHGVYLGTAADPGRAGPLREVMRGLVVDRGDDARPIREALPLRLPAQALAQLGEPTDGSGPDRQAT